jgi:hypothetical protein
VPLLISGGDPKNGVQYISGISGWTTKPLFQIAQQKMADSLPRLVGKRKVNHGDTC